MRRSYSLYPGANTGEVSKYEQALAHSEEQSRAFWDDPENYYEDYEDELYYQSGYDWNERNNPSNDAYYSPDKKVTRNILASNIGLMAKKGDDNIVHVMASDLLTAQPLSEVSLDIFDLQMQLISSTTTKQDGSATIFCERKPFLIVAKKDKDRN